MHAVHKHWQSVSSVKIYRNLNSLYFITLYTDQVCGVKFVIYGDFSRVPSKYTPSVIISNHGSLFDLHSFIRGFIHIGSTYLSIPLTTERFRHTHVYVGWLKQMHHFIFIKRDWNKDLVHINKMIHYLLATGPPIHVIIYPEGNVLTEGSKKADVEYAQSKGLIPHKYLLHPRVKGFAACVQACRSGHNGRADVYEMTIGYKGNPGQCAYAGPFGGVQLPTGDLPKEIHIHMKYHPSSSLPSSDEELGEWLRKRWREKDELLKQFYETNSFPGPVLRETFKFRQWMKLLIGIWIISGAAFVYCWIQVPLMMAVIMGTTALIHYIVDKWFDGWDRLALKRWEDLKEPAK